MPIPPNEGQPSIHPSARIAPNAIIRGDVHIGENCSIGYGTVIVAEGGAIRIGANCVIMDTAVVRGVTGAPVTVGDHVLVGPRAYLVGCTVEDECFLATGATVFNGAVIGKQSEVRINGLVHLRTHLPPNSMVPIGWVAVGNPAAILPSADHDAIWEIQKTMDFPKYVFNVERESSMVAMIGRYANALGRMYPNERMLCVK